MKEIWISGEIGYQVTAQTVSEQLRELSGDDVTINLNTVGGSVWEGFEIYNVLRQYAGKKIIKMGAIVASVGAYIACSGDEIIAQDFTSYMIHEARTWISGTVEEIEHEMKQLTRLNDLYSARLVEVSGKTDAQIRAWMKEETWFYGQEIVDAGFADRMQETGRSEDREVAVAISREKYQKFVASHKKIIEPSEKTGGSVAAVDNPKREKSMETKEEVLARVKALFENGKLTLREVADSVGASAQLVTEEHRQALSTVKKLETMLTTDKIIEAIESRGARLAELAKTERSASLTEVFGPIEFGVGEASVKNLVREYAEERITKTATGPELAAEIKAVKESEIAKRLAGEMIDPNSQVNQIESRETPADGSKPREQRY